MTIYPVSKLMVCTPFHFNRERLHFLRQILSAHVELADVVHVCISTNTSQESELTEIQSCIPEQNERYSCRIDICDQLSNPWLLEWSHKRPFKEAYYSNENYSHFLANEDDMPILSNNLFYWVQAREDLKPFDLYPSFFRVEWDDLLEDWTVLDVATTNEHIHLSTAKTVVVNGHEYVNKPNPHQGLIFYDR